MQKALKIVGVRTIFGTKKPIVVLDVANHPAIVRNPRQAFIDLQNSGRCLTLPKESLDRGIEGMNPHARSIFIKALLRTKGAIIEGDFNVTKAGDKYVPNENHPIFVDRNYPGFNTLKLGDSLIAEKDGVWVEGFCTIAETAEELDREANAYAFAEVRTSMLGSSMSFPMPVAETLERAEELGVEDDTTTNEAFGTEQEQENLPSELPAKKTK